MNLSIIIPVYNERDFIVSVIHRLEQSNCQDCQLIFVDDGSTDGTRELLEQHVPEPCERIFLPVNRGKTAAVMAGLELATRDWIIIQDADLEYDPNDILRLYQRAESSIEQPVAVYGRRPSCWWQPSRWPFVLGVLTIDIWLWILFRQWVRDHASCYKLLPRQVINEIGLQSTGFEGCVEITAKLMAGGIPILQIPISYTPRSYREGKKLLARYWFTALRTAWQLGRFDTIRI
ncbi:MAG: glycosyltransferase family 2 protein [Planctomycetales bacterium]|nr:glycosyltransferase family 2 protein [Planctomycetales bacterium]